MLPSSWLWRCTLVARQPKAEGVGRMGTVAVCPSRSAWLREEAARHSTEYMLPAIQAECDTKETVGSKES